jgi:hypothetical protein
MGVPIVVRMHGFDKLVIEYLCWPQVQHPVLDKEGYAPQGQSMKRKKA